jgi:hypothetical protein
MNRISSSRAFWTILAAFVFPSSHAHDPATSQAGDSQDERFALEQSRSSTSPETRAPELLLGMDADGDGIRDDLSELLSSQSAPSSREIKPSVVQRELEQAVVRNQSATATAPRSRCLDYLLLDPKDRAAADRYVQNRTQGAFGTHPCDPIVSPRLSRPFETDLAELQLGPVRLEYSHYE